jgi:hypothetical protein
MFDEDLTPYDGWQSPKDYKKKIKDNGGYLYFYFEDVGSKDKDDTKLNHVLNNDLFMVFEQIPIRSYIQIPKKLYNKYQGIFGDMWIPLFYQWFYEKTGIKVDRIIQSSGI